MKYNYAYAGRYKCPQKRSELLSLRAKIKGLAEEGIRLHKLIKESSDKKRNDYWDLKRGVGRETRHHLLAYGLLRGLNHEQMESNYTQSKLKELSYSYLAQICQHHCRFFDVEIWTANNIDRLISTGSMLIPVKLVGGEK